MHQNKGNVRTWTTFKWAGLNDISAALQSLPVGIHPLSPQLPYGMLTQHLAPSDHRLHSPREKTQPVCNLRVPALPEWREYSYTWQAINFYITHLIFPMLEQMASVHEFTVMKDKSNATGWSTEMFWLGAAGRSNAGVSHHEPARVYRSYFKPNTTKIVSPDYLVC